MASGQLAVEPGSVDTALCLSVTKWVHINAGDAGLKASPCISRHLGAIPCTGVVLELIHSLLRSLGLRLVLCGFLLSRVHCSKGSMCHAFTLGVFTEGSSQWGSPCFHHRRRCLRRCMRRCGQAGCWCWSHSPGAPTSRPSASRCSRPQLVLGGSGQCRRLSRSKCSVPVACGDLLSPGYRLKHSMSRLLITHCS